MFVSKLKEKIGLPSERTMQRNIEKHRFGTGYSNPKFLEWVQNLVQTKQDKAIENKHYPPSLVGNVINTNYNTSKFAPKSWKTFVSFKLDHNFSF